jgi:hypothetical protein
MTTSNYPQAVVLAYQQLTRQLEQEGALPTFIFYRKPGAKPTVGNEIVCRSEDLADDELCRVLEFHKSEVERLIAKYAKTGSVKVAKKTADVMVRGNLVYEELCDRCGEPASEPPFVMIITRDGKTTKSWFGRHERVT